MAQNMNPTFHAGLDGIVAADTAISSVDGLAGELIIGGFEAEELAPNASFEEVVYLVWNGRLPTSGELEDLKQSLASRRALPETAMDALRAAASRDVPSMDALRMASGLLSLERTADLSKSSNENDALDIVARFPTITAAYARLTAGQDPIPPREDLGHAANYLYMIFGEEPSAERVRALDTYLNTVVDHGLNASTFAARVIIATQSDLVSAVTGGVGALKGPLHGGAPGPALDMVFEIGSAERAEPYVREKLERGERIMGFGHRVYKVRDPRADILKDAASRLFEAGDADPELYALAGHVEGVTLRLLEEYKPGRRLQTNVEYFTALLLHGLGLTTDIFTPTFAVSRAAGWIAHSFEQLDTGRIIRPQSIYSGPAGRRWQAVEERG